MQREIRSLEELDNFALEWLAQLPIERAHATLVYLRGELGAGKTAFTKALAKALRITDLIQSPTFVLMRQYPIRDGGAFRQLVHIDAYRLEQATDLIPLRFDELYSDPSNLILLEWPEMIEPNEYIPTQTLSISVHDHDQRTFSTT